MPDTAPNQAWPAPSGQPAGGHSERTEDVQVVPTGAAHSSRRWATVGGLGAGLIGGVTAGLVFGVPGLSGASGAPALGGAVPAQTEEQSPADQADRSENLEERRDAATERIRENLQALVDDGTLDAARADAVSEHLASELPSRPGQPGRGPIAREVIESEGAPGDRITGRLRVGPERMDAIAEALGIERDDLVDRVLDGETLAEIAEAQDVDEPVLVDLLIAERVERIDQAVADGEIDPDEAAERKAALEELVTAHLNGDHPAGPRGRWEQTADADSGD